MAQKDYRPVNGYLMAIIALGLAGYLIYAAFNEMGPIYMLIGFVCFLFIIPGFFLVYPNGSRVLTLFGKYVGTVRNNGFFWVIPFIMKRSISLRARNFDSDRVKVNDKRGNPILISVILVWRVNETFKAAFDVDNYESFVRVQTDAAVRKLAGLYSYDNFDDEQEEVTLRSGVNIINEDLEKELDDRLNIAGIEVLEARIGYLAYAEEIAAVMLKRQQAEAIIAARLKIVEGAVGMVDNAITQLSKRKLIDLDDHQKATMVSNLMVVLCSDRDATPVVNAGTLHA
ncbi:MAG: SPFH domain-containing protein [Bacteroidia bacterium]|nr:SPFH domain-containing protein [Bacteroidia bacterium]